MTSAGLALACSCSGKVDPAPIIEPVTKSLNEVGISVTDIDCPRDVPVSGGNSFQCTIVTTKGESIPVRVTQRDEGGQLRLAWEIGSDLVVTDKHLPALTGYVRSVSADLTVTCPKAVVVPGGNGRLECALKDSKGQTGTLVVPIEGGSPAPDEGRWSVEQS